MTMNRTVIIVHLSRPWTVFHRRSMLIELSESLPPEVCVLCVDRPVTLDVTWWHRPGRFFRHIWRSNLSAHSDRLFLATVRTLLHDDVLRRFPLMSRINARLLNFQLQRMVRSLTFGDARVVQWVYGPEQSWARLIFPGARLIYECYDEYMYTPDGRLRRAVRDLETTLLRTADLTFVTTNVLLERRSHLTKAVRLLTNGVPSEFLDQPAEISDTIDTIAHPRIGYVGVIREPADLELLREVFSARPEWQLVLVGPVDRSADTRRIQDLPNVQWVGPRHFGKLPSILRKLDVGLIPLRLNTFSLAMRPLKLAEYLSAGLPVASSRLPELDGMESLVSFFDPSRESCEAALERALARRTPGFRHAAQSWAKQVTWRRIAERDILPALKEQAIL